MLLVSFLKNVFFVLMVFLLFFGCIQLQQPVEKKQSGVRLGFDFTLNEAITSRVTVHQISIKNNKIETKMQETVLLPIKSNENGFDLEAYVTKAVLIKKNKSENLCKFMTLLEKKNLFNISKDGTVVTSDGKTYVNLFLPQKYLNEKDTWEFDGLTYTLGKKTEIEVVGGKFEAYEIRFRGTRGGIFQEGKIFFSPKGFTVKREEKHVFDEGTIDLIYEVISIESNVFAQDVDLNCANTEYVKSLVVGPVLKQEVDENGLVKIPISKVDGVNDQNTDLNNLLNSNSFNDSNKSNDLNN